MLRNQKGDALTLAMGAAVFVGISVMVTIAIMSNLNSKMQRARVVNDVEGVMLYINQILSNRDMCAFALRQGPGDPNPGQAYEIPLGLAPTIWPGWPGPIVVPTAAAVARTVLPIGRIYLTSPIAATSIPTSPPVYEQGQAIATVPGITIREMRFEFNNELRFNSVAEHNGDRSGRYRRITGQLEVDVDFGQGAVMGGELRPRNFPLQIVFDTTTRRIATCYTRESPVQICSQLGGTINVASGTCESMFGGMCGVPPNDPPCRPLDLNVVCDPPDLRVINLYYATTIHKGMQLHCECSQICTTGP